MRAAACTTLTRQAQVAQRARPARRAVRVMAAAEPLFDIAVKANGDKQELGDCPFCHRALLTLEEKRVPYKTTLIDFAAKPDWLLEVNPAGSVPVMKDLATGEWVVDSGAICDFLEAQFPQPALGTVEASPQIGLDVLGKFAGFIKSSPEEAAAKEAELVECLRGLDAHLAAHGPFIGGAAPCATDMAVWPRLYHMQVTTRYFRGWEMPGDLAALRAYIAAYEARPSWKRALYTPEAIIAGWERHGVKKVA